jgi:hypothetical protein
MPTTPQQQRIRARFERLIALAAPLLDGMLAVGDRVSRIAGPEDEPIPIRAPGDAFELRRAQPGRALNGDDPTSA